LRAQIPFFGRWAIAGKPQAAEAHAIDALAELLTDQDVETLKPVERGVGDNTSRALTSDLAHLKA